MHGERFECFAITETRNHFGLTIKWYREFHRSADSRNPSLQADDHQIVYFRLPDIVAIGLKILLDSLHLFEKNPGQNPFFEGPQNAIDRQ
jgi:hypothetical protein